jgi:hypothetical protein
MNDDIDDGEKCTAKPKKTSRRSDCTASEEDGVEERKRDREGKDQKKKKQRKKKDKKRKRDDDGDDGDGCAGGDDDDSPTHREIDDSSSCGGDENLSKSERRNERRRSKDERRNARRIRRRKEMDDRIVASSAIQYYPDDLKRDHLQSNIMEKGQEDAIASLSDDMGVSARENRSKGKRRGGASSSPSGHDVTMEADEGTTTAKANDLVTLLLFYQYVEPPWDEIQFRNAYEFATNEANGRGITGRMRIAREGMNCTLTGSPEDVRGWCAAMRLFDGGRARIDPSTGTRRTEFADTEFKLTDDLPPRQRFPKLHAFEVVELVNYGLAGSRAPDLSRHGGTHLEPEDYHRKMCEPDTVVIDVRNHYEANIGRFDPPEGGARVIDPMMRKSTEFPLWLDKKETKEMLRGKQVLMYCTGGVR